MCGPGTKLSFVDVDVYTVEHGIKTHPGDFISAFENIITGVSDDVESGVPPVMGIMPRSPGVKTRGRDNGPALVCKKLFLVV